MSSMCYSLTHFMQHALSSLLPADKIVDSIAVNVSNLRSAAIARCDSG